MDCTTIPVSNLYESYEKYYNASEILHLQTSRIDIVLNELSKTTDSKSEYMIMLTNIRDNEKDVIKLIDKICDLCFLEDYADDML